MAEFIKSLDKISKRDEKYIGNKSKNVATMLRRGFLVPTGFCVTSNAYREFLKRSRLEKQLIALAAGAASKSIPQLEEASRKIYHLILSKKVPSSIRDEIVDGYQELIERLGDSTAWVAVRSSAMMEDSPDASFAGQYDSFLYVRGAEEVVSQTVKCWASLWSSRAVHYRELNGFAHADAGMGVLVQQMVPSEASGVLFTADPMTDDRSVIVASGGWGLGEGIVSGAVSQDTFTVNKKNFRILEKVISDKKSMVIKGKRRGTQSAEVPDELRNTPCLSDPRVRKLAELGLRLEEHFGAPQDVEWGLHEGQFYILQSRPITTLKSSAPSRANEFPIQWESEEDRKGYWMWGERVQTKPMSPLAQSINGSYRIKGVEKAVETLAMPFLFEQKIFNGYFYMRQAPIKGNKAKIEERNRRNRSQIKKHINSWEKEYLHEVLRDIKYMQNFDLAGASMDELLDHLDRLLSMHHKHWFIHFMAAFPMVAVIERFMETFVNLTGIEDPMQAYKLLQGFSNKSIEANRELWLLSQEVKKSPTVRKCFKENGVDQIPHELEKKRSGRRFLVKLNDYLESYGSRITTGIDVIEPTLKEDPSYFLPLLKGFIDRPSFDHDAMQKKSAAERKKAVAEAYKKIGASESKRRRFTRELERAQKFIPFLEDHTFYIDQMDTAQMRYLFLELGDRLCTAGVIAEREDIFFLIVDEIKDAARNPSNSKLRTTVRKRKRQREKWLNLSPPPWIGTPPPEDERPPPSAGGSWYYQGLPIQGTNLLRGLPGSPGTVVGRARIVHSTEEFSKVQPGDILVCPSTLPPWTPLFSIIGGMVTNTGAALQHDAIIAREYGIPAVVGTKVATKMITDGQLIGVDGTEGLVRLH